MGKGEERKGKIKVKRKGRIWKGRGKEGNGGEVEREGERIRKGY